MSTNTVRLHEDDFSPSSEEKMDTGSESLRSLQSMQDTPNSALSSDGEDPEQSFNSTMDQSVLRLQDPEVLRLTEPQNENVDNILESMSNLRITSPLENSRPKHLGITKFSSTLISTTDHPLMGLGSPEENYPDLIPKKHKEDDKDLSLSSIEEDKIEANGFYSPHRNSSKNNLYFNDNFSTAESHMLSSSLDVTSPPDVARGIEVKKCQIHRMLGHIPVENKSYNNVNRLESQQVTGQSTPKKSNADGSEAEEFHTGVSDWPESPAHVARPNFDLPIEMKTKITANNEPESPDVVSSSQDERSAYQALLDPYTGSVALRPTRPPLGLSPHAHAQRRKIQLPPDDEQCSLDSGSIRSLESEEEPPSPSPSPDPEPQPEPGCRTPSDQDHSKRSTNTLSSCSEQIPEYSAAEELRDERSWLSVPRPGGPATCDMKVIEPYKRVISHGGYDAAGCALVVFGACHLPDVRRADYHYVMDNLFLYVIWTLERLVTEQYVLVYLYGSAGARRLPTVHWLREYYRLVDRRLRKSLKHLYIVHPTYGLKIFVAFTKAFVSSKFFKKLSYVRNLDELMSLIPVEPNAIPDIVKQYDAGRR